MVAGCCLICPCRGGAVARDVLASAPTGDVLTTLSAPSSPGRHFGSPTGSRRITRHSSWSHGVQSRQTSFEQHPLNVFVNMAWLRVWRLTLSVYLQIKPFVGPSRHDVHSADDTEPTHPDEDVHLRRELQAALEGMTVPCDAVELTVCLQLPHQSLQSPSRRPTSMSKWRPSASSKCLLKVKQGLTPLGRHLSRVPCRDLTRSKAD